jgi:hypothetical protein
MRGQWCRSGSAVAHCHRSSGGAGNCTCSTFTIPAGAVRAPSLCRARRRPNFGWAGWPLGCAARPEAPWLRAAAPPAPDTGRHHQLSRVSGTHNRFPIRTPLPPRTRVSRRRPFHRAATKALHKRAALARGVRCSGDCVGIRAAVAQRHGHERHAGNHHVNPVLHISQSLPQPGQEHPAGARRQSTRLVSGWAWTCRTAPSP